jgi:AcrR family transcriptional regulator
MADRPYHHGDLHRELLRQAAGMIAEVGPGNVSLRELARRAGVSHAAPAHHFGDKAGLLTAIATEGFHLLADQLTEALERTGDFLEVGVAYVEFAVAHRAHFEVMFRPDLYDADATEVRAARAQSSAALYGGVSAVPGAATGPDTRTAGLAAWSIVHGFASLWITGALPANLGTDAGAVARQVAGVLFAHPGTGRDPRQQTDDEPAAARR